MIRHTRQLGTLYKAGKKSYTLSPLMPSVSQFDEKTFSAKALIATPSPDRVNDSLSMEGCSLVHYRTNPVVLWNHGEELTLPIGKSEHPDGSLAIEITPQAMTATSYFSQSLKEAVQIAHLVKEGIVRAASVRVTPTVRPQTIKGGVKYFPEWELTEWSWVPIGMNPEAVRETLSKGYIDGCQIIEPIRKSLSLLIPEERQVQVRGATLEAEKMLNEHDKACDMEKDKVTSVPPSDVVIDDEELDDVDTELEDDDMDEPAEEVAEEMKKFGQQMLDAMYRSVSELKSNTERGMKVLENPKVSEAVESVMEMIESAMARLEGAYSESYGGSLMPKAADMPTADEMEESYKSFLAQSAGGKFEIMSAINRLKSIAGEKNLTESQRKSLVFCQKNFARILRESKKAATPATVAKSADVDPTQEVIGGMLDVLKDIRKALPKRK